MFDLSEATKRVAKMHTAYREQEIKQIVEDFLMVLSDGIIELAQATPGDKKGHLRLKHLGGITVGPTRLSPSRIGKRDFFPKEYRKVSLNLTSETEERAAKRGVPLK